MTQHTPGPWDYVPGTEHHGPYVTSDYGTTICDCYVMSLPNEWSTAAGGQSKPINHLHEMAEPNARLIAAAPDLLALARAMMQAIETCGDQPIMAWRGAIALHIAKATSQGSPDTIEPSNAEGMVP